MKKIALYVLVLFTLNTFSQELTYTFGKPTKSELDLMHYNLDSTANAAVLFESGKTIFKEKYGTVIISTTFYKKIKIFNKNGFEYASFSIPLYHLNKNDKERVLNIKAVTHNGMVKTGLDKKEVFVEKINDKWKELKFTMPNLKPGSLIEVEYTLESPFKYNLTGWEFQSEIPKKRSNRSSLGSNQPNYSIAEINSLTFSKDSLKEITVEMDL